MRWDAVAFWCRKMIPTNRAVVKKGQRLVELGCMVTLGPALLDHG